MHAAVLILFLTRVAAPQSDPPSIRPAECRDWHECQTLALDAAERRQYETFHDLAWRTVQTGPKNDSALMYLLARAQSLSGRPHDALVMLQRLAEMGVPSDASTNDDFARVRTLAGWPEVEALIERARTAAASVAPTPTAPSPAATTSAATATRAPVRGATSVAKTPSAAPPPVAPAAAAASTPGRVEAARTAPAPATPAKSVPTPAIPATTGEPAPAIAVPATAVSTPPPANAANPAPATPAKPAPPRFPAALALVPVEQAVRISTPRFSAGGLAYDAASGRFVVGDQHGRKLFVVEDGADHPVDLVRAESGGFGDIRAIEIDSRRGDLWVVTAAADEGEWSIHLVQLISGRPLRAWPVDAALGPARLVDLAVNRGGTLLALDAAGKRLFELKPREAGLRPVPLTVEGATSLAVTDDDGVIYVAGREGVARTELKSGTSTAVSFPPGLEVGTIESIRWHRQALVAVEADRSGARRLVRFDLNAAGRAVTGATVIDETIAAARGRIFATVSGDLLSYVSSEADPPGQFESGTTDRPTELVIRRLHLR